MSVSELLVVPPNRCTGALPRSSRVGSICPLAAEHIDLIPSGEWAGLIAQRQSAAVNMRDFIRDINDQDGVGSCATESTAKGIETQRLLHGLPYVALNPWFIYSHTSGGVDRGSSIDENLEFVRKYGCASKDVWPRSKGWRTKPTQEAYHDALQYKIDEFYDVTTTQEIGSCLLKGHVVVFGWQSHSELMIDLISPSTALVVNSWGDTWSGDGMHEVRLSSVNFMYGCFAIRTTS